MEGASFLRLCCGRGKRCGETARAHSRMARYFRHARFRYCAVKANTRAGKVDILRKRCRGTSMSDGGHLLGIVQTALGTFEHRRPYSPGMFDPLEPLFRSLGYESVAVYITDDYPDRMHMASGYGGADWFPDRILLGGKKSLHEELRRHVSGVPGVMTASLFSHGRELGALAATTSAVDAPQTRDAFDVLARSMSVMAYVERIRTNGRRERQEREVFFAQSLTNRLLIRQTPKIKGLRLGFQFNRSLEAGGDFFDFVPTRDGGLLGFLGRCNGKGLRTVLEVCNLMRETHRSCHCCETPAETIRRLNDILVREKRRAHQASLCLFRVDTKNHRLHLAKAGHLGLFLCGPGQAVRDISASGGMFLGMISKLKIQDETLDFHPGHSLFCATEGVFSSSDGDGAQGSRELLRAMEEALAARRKVPLADAVFARLEDDGNSSQHTDEPKLALSVECVKAAAAS